MIEISINKITKSYGFNNILNNLTFEVKTGEIIALIGENGCGKSTLLNIISGEERIDQGNISIRKGNTIGYLKQSMEQEKTNMLVKEILYRNAKDILDIRNQLQTYEHKMAQTTGYELDKLIVKYTNLQEQFISIGGYELDSRIDKIVAGFKIEHLLDKNYNNLSGGEKRIVSLAAIMINNPNILLLDEPTNHLDIDTLEWFEDFLRKYNGTVLIVSHDRYFIDRLANKIILIEKGKEIIFHGNYSCYLQENDLRLEKEFKDYKDQSKIIDAMKKKIKQLEQFGKLAYPQGEAFFRRAENIRKRLERLEIIDKPIVKKDIPINFEIKDRSGKEVIVIKDYTLKINNTILVDNININIAYQDKICIMGSNGSGKSTLIKKIIENKNENIKIGSNVKIGYIPQEINFFEDLTILDYTRKFFVGDESHLRSTLNKFYFHGNNVYKRVTKISGGEKVRLKLLELMQSKCNCIILDEPTNHIDITTKELLEEALKEYQGTVIFISHDRYFINKLANKILFIENNRITEYSGNYDDYKNLKSKQQCQI